MIAYHIVGPKGLDALQPVVIPDPDVGVHDVLVQAQAWSLNYRDLSMPFGGYPGNDKVRNNPPLVPLSDVAGRVIAVGENVTRFSVGDRVAANFFRDWVDGELDASKISSALGGAIDGVLSEKVCLPERAWVHIPKTYDFQQAATLPCAAVTAWQSLQAARSTPGQTVLLLGTGGVSIFALQLAKASGMRVIITSSSDQKLERARQLGADETINYRQQANWEDAVGELTDHGGVDHVVEVGGAGTLARSLESVRISGTVSLIGVLTGRVESHPSMYPALFKRVTVRGIYVGSRRMFEDLVRAVEVNEITPVIDRVFSFDDARAAYEYLQSGQHFGKVVIKAPEST